MIAAADFEAFADAITDPNTAPPRAPDMAVFYTSDYAGDAAPNTVTTSSPRPTPTVSTHHVCSLFKAVIRASIRMIGARVAESECINGEGTKSLHMADGATLLVPRLGSSISTSGRRGIGSAFPGTTVQVNGTVLNCSTSDSTGVLPNVGGVTDGLIGMTYSASKRLRISVPEKPFRGLAQWTLLNLHMGN